MIGQTISHYTILEKLGEGGMGVVYKARDTRLDREVALKFLPSELTKDREANERFLQEAKAASALNHPNICSIHAIEGHEGQQFIDMEFVEGKTLSTLLNERELPLNEVLDITVQIAEGLRAAHKKGVVHRDVKPDNIMRSDEGLVKIMDFGLAKLKRESKLTKSYSTLGTLSYMSPEQVQGLEVDQRTDIFSLGVLLYEMVARRRPFKGEHEAAILYSILNEPPEPLARYKANVPDALGRIVEKALAKKREERYQHVDEMIADIKAATSTVAPSAKTGEVLPKHRNRRRVAIIAGVVVSLAAIVLIVYSPLPRHPNPIDSIAVLPLENLSHDPEQEYFSDGMTEALITELSHISMLKKVISRTSAMVYKGVRKPLPEIARALDVAAIVEGSVLRSGTKVRISVQLIDASADKHLWAKNYERDMNDILALQGEVAQAIAREVNLTLTPSDEQRFRSARQIDPRAQELYLKGRFFWNKRTSEGLQKAAEYFKQAILIDSAFALAYSGLADCYNMLPFYANVRPVDAYPKAREAALEATRIDSTLAEGATSLAYYLYGYEWKKQEAEQWFKRAIGLNPRYSTAHHWYGVFLGSVRRFDEGLLELQKARELDPLSLIISSCYGDLLYRSRRYDDAIAQYQKTLEMDSNFAPARAGIVDAYCEKHMYREAVKVFSRSDRPWPGILRALVALGREKEALEIVSRIAEASRRIYLRNDAIALAYLGIGEKGKALEFLEKGALERDPQLPEDIYVNPVWDPLRKDPRFTALLQKLGFE